MRAPLTAAALMALITGCAISTNPASTDPGESTAGDVATVTRLIDGDSMDVEIDGRPDEVRLLGINAPEGDECYGDVARENLAKLIGFDTVALVAADEDRDGFGRMLRYLVVEGRDINAEMVARGHATVLQGDHPRNERYARLSDDAWDDRLGMWNPEACGSRQDGAVVDIVEIRHDPPGPDDEVLEEEWVEIENTGTEPVDLSAWIVRDESSRNRLRLPGPSLAPGDRVRIRSGCGTDSATDLHWCAERSIWSNGGDTVILQDPDGNVVARERYP